MAKKEKEKKLNKEQSLKKITELKKSLFNLRFKKINGQLENPSEYRLIKKDIARLYTNLNSEK